MNEDLGSQCYVSSAKLILKPITQTEFTHKQRRDGVMLSLKRYSLGSEVLPVFSEINKST